MKTRKNQKAPQITPHVHYCPDDYSGGFRFWQSWNAPDQFEIIPYDKADAHRAAVKSIGTIIREGYPEDDNGEPDCALCYPTAV
jgi:hypothetical protein